MKHPPTNPEAPFLTNTDSEVHTRIIPQKGHALVGAALRRDMNVRAVAVVPGRKIGA